MMNVRIHIERLVLEGVPVTHAQGSALRAAVEAELTRLLAAGDLAPGLQAGGALRRVVAPAIALPGDPAPEYLGRQIARAVHTGLGWG
ncbi:MAG: hypothetical protein ACTHMP_20775 [Thermomicrobiales bacterium]